MDDAQGPRRGLTPEEKKAYLETHKIELNAPFPKIKNRELAYLLSFIMVFMIVLSGTWIPYFITHEPDDYKLAKAGTFLIVIFFGLGIPIQLIRVIIGYIRRKS